MQTTRQLLRFAEEALHSSDTPRLDAEVLLASLLNVNRSRLYACPDGVIEDDTAGDFFRLLQNRKNGAPVAYLTGEKEFWSIRLSVNENTLIPRPETESLVALALEHIPADDICSILDLGTGSGAIAIAIAASRPACGITAVDSSIEALEVAGQNAMANKISNIAFLQSDWFSEIQHQRYDCIVSNPPYVDYLDEKSMTDALQHEPREALDGGYKGRDHLKRIIAGARGHLKSGGLIIVEHGYDQGEFVRDQFTSNHYENVRTRRDLAGHERHSFAFQP